MRSLIVVALILGIVLLSLLFYASSGSSAFSDTLPTLFIGGGILGVALLVLLGWRMWWGGPWVATTLIEARKPASP